MAFLQRSSRDLRGIRYGLTTHIATVGVVRISNYLVSLITLPYWARVLGAEAFGKFGFGAAACAVPVYGAREVGAILLPRSGGYNNQSRAMTTLQPVVFSLPVGAGYAAAGLALSAGRKRADRILARDAFLGQVKQFVPETVMEGPSAASPVAHYRQTAAH